MSIDALRNCSLFEGFTEEALAALSSIASTREIPAGTPLFAENTHGDALYVVAEGILRISVGAQQGRDRVLTILTEGEAFGELSLLVPAPRVVSAVAESDLRVLEIRRSDFLGLQRKMPKACLKLILTIIERFRTGLGENRELLGNLLVGAVR